MRITSFNTVLILCIHDSFQRQKQYVVMLPSRTAMAVGAKGDAFKVLPGITLL